MMVIRINGQMQLSWQIARAKTAWVGVCDALKLTLEGDTYVEVCSVADEVLNDLLRDLLRTGELEKFLSDMGWRSMTALPKFIPDEGLKFDVPQRFEPVTDAHAN